MAIPDYADPRSHRFFNTGFVGKGHGDNGTSLHTSWNTMHRDLKPTKVYKAPQVMACAYCGNDPLLIQDEYLEHGPIIGYTCCCKGAMDERHHEALVIAMREEHAEQLRELQAKAPKPSQEVLIAVINANALNAIERINKGGTLTEGGSGVKVVSGSQTGEEW